MAFGFKSKPSMRYAYHVLALRGDANLVVMDQMYKAHRFQNKLIEIELGRRELARIAARAASPELEELLIEYANLTAEIEMMEEQLRRAKVTARHKTPDKSLAAQIREKRAERKAVGAERQDANRKAYRTPQARLELDRIGAEVRAKEETARKEAVAGGLYWATASSVMTRIPKDGPPPRFRRFQGTGSIAIQFQRESVKGSPVEPILKPDGTPRIGRNGKPMMRATDTKPMRSVELFQGTSLFKLERLIVDGVPHPRRMIVSWRAGSNEKHEPIWVKFVTVMHRPLPPEAQIKWVNLICKKIGTKRRWGMQFVIEHQNGPRADKAETGMVAVALGWRMIGEKLRTAVWVGDDGCRGEVVIEKDKLDRWWRFARDLRSIRDTRFNTDKEVLNAWLTEHKPQVPPELLERASFLPQWRSPARLAALIIWWRTNRFPGDEEIFTRMEGELQTDAAGKRHYTGGRRQDKHLYDWQEGSRSKGIRWRKYYYRQVAIALSKRYAKVVTAEIDWAKLAKNKELEDSEEEVNKTHYGVAAVKGLTELLNQYMTPVKVEAAGIVITCHECGSEMADPGAGRWVTCENCGTGKIDRADNAADNLLDRGMDEDEPEE